MTGVLLFIVLPLLLIGLSFFIRPRRHTGRDPWGGSLAAQGMFGRPEGLGQPEEPVVREDDDPRPFKLD